MMSSRQLIVASSLWLAVVALAGCDSLRPGATDSVDLDQRSNFDVRIIGEVADATIFPLSVGMKATYKLVLAEGSGADILPESFMVEVQGQEDHAGVAYYRIQNYLTPTFGFTPTESDVLGGLGKSVLVRSDGNAVYALADGTEQLIYTFPQEEGETEAWSVRGYLGEVPWSAKVGATGLTSSSLAVGWDYPGFMGGPEFGTLAEGGWGEVFEAGKGRVRIVSMSQRYSAVWDLVELSVSP